jgi:hypothetical protein
MTEKPTSIPTSSLNGKPSLTAPPNPKSRCSQILVVRTTPNSDQILLVRSISNIPLMKSRDPKSPIPMNVDFHLILKTNQNAAEAMKLGSVANNHPSQIEQNALNQKLPKTAKRGSIQSRNMTLNTSLMPEANSRSEC